MGLNILYIEDSRTAREKLELAVSKRNAAIQMKRLSLTSKSQPEDVTKEDVLSADLVLADVYFHGHDRLDDIVRFVSDTCSESGIFVPIIAYTGKGETALKRCLKLGNRLYEIWDKNSADANYVAYKLTNLANQLSLTSPDLYMCRKILEQSNGPTWHERTLGMIQKYRAGTNEMDQITRPGTQIDVIGKLMGVNDCGVIWRDLICRWEMIERSTIAATRGHARHLLNVFWLGYYLLNHDALRDFLIKPFSSQSDADHASGTTDAEIDFANSAWFFAGLFHDMGNSIEKGGKAIRATHEIQRGFAEHIEFKFNKHVVKLKEKAKHEARSILYSLNDDHTKQTWYDVWEKSCNDGAPDSGVMAGVFINHFCHGTRAEKAANEAARAMAVHNIIGNISSEGKCKFDWEADPLVCLLVICDQFQTWDRERGDDTLLEEASDLPSRAELLSVDVSGEGSDVTVKISINYVAPLHVLKSPVLMERAIDRMCIILAKHPDKAVQKISRPWPFKLQMRFWLSGTKLDRELDYPECLPGS